MFRGFACKSLTNRLEACLSCCPQSDIPCRAMTSWKLLEWVCEAWERTNPLNLLVAVFARTFQRVLLRDNEYLPFQNTNILIQNKIELDHRAESYSIFNIGFTSGRVSSRIDGRKETLGEQRVYSSTEPHRTIWISAVTEPLPFFRRTEQRCPQDQKPIDPSLVSSLTAKHRRLRQAGVARSVES